MPRWPPQRRPWCRTCLRLARQHCRSSGIPAHPSYSSATAATSLMRCSATLNHAHSRHGHPAVHHVQSRLSDCASSLSRIGVWRPQRATPVLLVPRDAVVPTGGARTVGNGLEAAWHQGESSTPHKLHEAEAVRMSLDLVSFTQHGLARRWWLSTGQDTVRATLIRLGPMRRSQVRTAPVATVLVTPFTLHYKQQ